MATGVISAEAVLVQAMHLYSALVFRPYKLAKSAGFIARRTEGSPPPPSDRPGLGPHFSTIYKKPVLLGRPTENDALVEQFDRMGEIYDAYVRPFSGPLMDEAVTELRRYVRPDYRILDAGCGAGREVCRISRLVPKGEVVGIDLAAGMINAAYRAARAKGFDNTAFFQSDVGDLPKAFSNGFDLIYSSLAHHHYPDPPAATAEIFRALRPGGYYAVIDAGPDWYVKSSSQFALWSDPGWIGFHTPDQFIDLFRAAGFVNAGWIDLLPGFGIACAQKPL
jgi:ubiquinone/menaquinone biosynthesis C-methylase UbiE